MKKILFCLGLLALACPQAVKAQTQVYTAVSSATWCYISVSTYQPTRVDNFNGNCEGLMAGRTVLRILNGAGTLHGGYDVNLSTKPTDSKYGEVYSPNDFREFELSSAMQYYLMSEPADPAPKVIIQQARQNAQLSIR